jgi:hypothetical protein
VTGVGIRLLICVAGFCLLLPIQAAHAFGDCSASGYFGAVDERMAGRAVDCEEAARFTIDTPEGPRAVRIVHTPDLPTLDLPVMVREIRRGVERSAAALPSVGALAPADVTIWISHLLPNPEAPSDADDFEQDGQMWIVEDGCLMALYPANTGRRGLAFTAAHEFFHCVQGREFPDKYAGRASSWWSEGSAEWFANLALPGTGRSDGFVLEFDSDSRDTALTAMSHESVVFFFWLAEAHGAEAVGRMLQAMPADGGEQGQQAALASFLGAPEWQRFAEAYIAGDIRQPGGRSPRSSPFPGDIYVWENGRTHTLSAAPFVLARAQLEFSCGIWAVTEDDARGTRAFRASRSRWQSLPARIVVDQDGPQLFQMAGFGSGREGFSVTIEGTRDACQGCPATAGTARSLDQCLVGTWELMSGGYGQQIEDRLRESGIFESIDYPDLHRYLTLESNGRYSQGPSERGEQGESVQRTDAGHLWEGRSTLRHRTRGHWSTDGNVLHLCEEQVSVDIDLTIVEPDGGESRIRESGGPPDLGPLPRRRDFVCSAGTLSLVEPSPVGPGVRWEYRRMR